MTWTIVCSECGQPAAFYCRGCKKHFCTIAGCRVSLDAEGGKHPCYEITQEAVL